MCVHGYMLAKSNFPVDDYLDGVPPPRIVGHMEQLRRAMEAMPVIRQSVDLLQSLA